MKIITDHLFKLSRVSGAIKDEILVRNPAWSFYFQFQAICYGIKPFFRFYLLTEKAPKIKKKNASQIGIKKCQSTELCE